MSWREKNDKTWWCAIIVLPTKRWARNAADRCTGKSKHVDWIDNKSKLLFICKNKSIVMTYECSRRQRLFFSEKSEIRAYCNYFQWHRILMMMVLIEIITMMDWVLGTEHLCLDRQCRIYATVPFVELFLNLVRPWHECELRDERRGTMIRGTNEQQWHSTSRNNSFLRKASTTLSRKRYLKRRTNITHNAPCSWLDSDIVR